MKLSLWLALACLCFGCAASTAESRHVVDTQRRALAKRLQTERCAPAWMAREERARAQSRAANADSVQRGELEAAARLYLEAAIAECERLALERTRLDTERALEQAEGMALAASREQQALEQAEELRAAREAAQAEVVRSLERAATEPPRRPKLERAQQLEAARALVVRAELALSAGRIAGLSEKALQRPSALLEQAKGALVQKPDAALELADQAFFAALAAYGEVRRASPVSAVQRQALATALAEAGLEVQSTERGLAARLAPVTGGRLSFTAQRKLERACALSASFAEGRIFVSGPVAASALATQLAEAGCADERFSIERREAGTTGMVLVFASY